MKLASMLPTTKELFYKIKPHIDTRMGKIYALEQALYSDNLKLAGRVDCIAEWDGVLSIIDFKSSTKQKDKNNIGNYFMQCTAYARMFTELTDKPLDQIVVLVGTEEGPGQIFIESADKYHTELQKYVDKHYRKVGWHFVIVVLYYMLWLYEEHVGVGIEQIVIIMAVENEEPLIFVEKTEDHINTLIEHISFYRNNR